jgi:uncharacterized membrane protein YdbT with pleckstrin-like domain
MAGQIERFHPEVPKELDRYLIPTEKIIFMVHRSLIVLFEPIVSALAGLIVVGLLDRALSGGALVLRDVAVVIWLLLVARLIFYTLEWRHELFLATDRRLMLVHGLVTRKVDIMPMSKVTDMRYDRSLTGKIFGFGKYILESAGQDQALSVINYIPSPDQHYQQISAVIFAPPQRRLSDRMAPASSGSKLPISEPEQAWWRRS